MRDVRRITAGDSLSFATTVDSYPASAGWTLVYRLFPRFSTPTQAPITLEAEAYETDRYRVDVASNDTTVWAPGEYGWASSVEKPGERITLETGQVTVAPDPAQVEQGTDTRSASEIALANVRATLAGTADKNVLSYRIKDRALEHYPIADLIRLEQKLIADVKRERNAADMALGRRSRRQIFGAVARV